MGEADWQPLVEIVPTEEKEVIRPTEVTIDAKVLAELNDRVRHSDSEFWAFILGKGRIGEQYVLVGIGHKHGVMSSPDQVIQALRPYVEQGLQVVADYHNHPEEVKAIYSAAGFPPEYAIGPSVADLRQDISKALQAVLKQSPYPRIIALANGQNQDVLLNAINVLKYPIPEERGGIEFDDPAFNASEDDGLVQIVGEKYGNPEAMIKKGYIEPIILYSHNEQLDLRISNPLVREDKYSD